MSEIRDLIRRFILDEFLAGEDEDLLTDTTPLRSSGILDSIALIRLVRHLEDRLDIRLEPQELDGDSFSTIEGIERTVSRKAASS